MSTKDELRRQVESLVEEAIENDRGNEKSRHSGEVADAILNLLEGENQKAFDDGCRVTELLYKSYSSRPTPQGDK